MADSNITKRALAAALKELMQKVPFSKISVADICEKCNMNRKSFYYHFQDKYELLNWIFDMDFIDLIKRDSANQTVEEIMALCGILYENRRFYRNALSVQGQNSLSDHIREIAIPLLSQRFHEVLADQEDATFYIDLFVDSLMLAIFRWIKDENCEPPEQFIPRFFAYVVSMAKYIVKKYPDPM